MNKILIDLLKKSWEKKIDKEQFFKTASIETGFVFSESTCLEKLNFAADEGDSDTIDIFITIGFMIGYTIKALPTMCRLLLIENHHKHEDIASLLQEFKSPTTIEALYKATEIRFNYLDYDDTFQLARKCINALSAIEDKNAITKLELISKSKISEIAEYAKKELRNKESY